MQLVCSTMGTVLEVSAHGPARGALGNLGGLRGGRGGQAALFEPRSGEFADLSRADDERFARRFPD